METLRGFNIFLILWGLGAIFSAIAHFVAGTWMASGTVWGYAQGWQSEIASFDLCWFGLIIYTLKAGSYELKRALVLALTLLSVVLGGNHLKGLLQSQIYLHIAGTAANALAIVIGGYLILTSQRNPL